MFKKRGLLQEYGAALGLGMQLLDLVTILLAGVVAGMLYLLPKEILEGKYLLLLGIVLLLANLVFNRMSLYTAWRSESLSSEIARLTFAWLIVLGLMSLFIFYSKSGESYSRVWVMIWFAFTCVLLVTGRIVLRVVLRALRQRGFNQRRILIVGQGALARDLQNRIEESRWMGLRVVCQVEANVQCLDSLVIEERIDQVWIALPLSQEEVVRKILDGLSLTSVEVRYVPDLFGFRLFSHSVSEVAGLPVINLSSTPMEGFNRVVKAIEDRVLSLLILLLIAPLLLLLALGVKLSSPGPVFYRQQRNGWGGKPIHVLKFRSMVVHQEAMGTVTQASKQDARITPFGAFLRRTSLDELPQFWNVLMGEMSIVGPRPHAVAHNDQYKVLVDDYMLRHRVKPGITGWAQINGYRGETDTLDKMQKRVEYDLYYIEHWSLWLDLKIIVLTVFKGFVNKNAY